MIQRYNKAILFGWLGQILMSKHFFMSLSIINENFNNIIVVGIDVLVICYHTKDGR